MGEHVGLMYGDFYHCGVDIWLPLRAFHSPLHSHLFDMSKALSGLENGGQHIPRFIAACDSAAEHGRRFVRKRRYWQMRTCHYYVVWRDDVVKRSTLYGRGI